MERNMQILFILFCAYSIVNCRSNFTVNEDFSKCKVEYSRSDLYTTFHGIGEQHTYNSLIFDFHFSVLAPRDAHILLTPSMVITTTDPVYEIVLGAGNNSFSIIRGSQKSVERNKQQTNDLLSSVDAKHFWIHFSQDGLLEVGKEGEQIAFLLYRDPNPLPIKYFSLASWGNAEIKWYYDCERTTTQSENHLITTTTGGWEITFVDYENEEETYPETHEFEQPLTTTRSENYFTTTTMSGWATTNLPGKIIFAAHVVYYIYYYIMIQI